MQATKYKDIVFFQLGSLDTSQTQSYRQPIIPLDLHGCPLPEQKCGWWPLWLEGGVERRMEREGKSVARYHRYVRCHPLGLVVVTMRDLMIFLSMVAKVTRQSIVLALSSSQSCTNHWHDEGCNMEQGSQLGILPCAFGQLDAERDAHAIYVFVKMAMKIVEQNLAVQCYHILIVEQKLAVQCYHILSTRVLVSISTKQTNMISVESNYFVSSEINHTRLHRSQT